MIKKELLAPAGDFMCLKYAVHNGADAVYIGGKKFGARAFAQNFSDSSMIEAINYCHLYGVSVYVTVNNMILEHELNDVMDYLEFLYLNHVDAVIMADLGLIKLAHEKFPELVIHASTQAHTHNKEQMLYLKELGVTRAVVARELSLREIKDLPDCLEMEAFIHGSLCVSYSGQCLFSSFLLNRSGNRGECAGICRLPFDILEDEKKLDSTDPYKLSMRDLNTSLRFEEMMNSNISSFKIEGRMKSPSYVGFVTHLYRNLMDRFMRKEDMTISLKTQEQASVLFSRGFTEGHLFLKKDGELLNQATSNHQGIKLGEILEVTSKKIKIKLEKPIHQEDGIRFVADDKGMMVNFLYNAHDNLINMAPAGDVIYVDNKVGVKNIGPVFKTIDFKLEKEYSVLTEKKIKIAVFAKASMESGFILTLSDGTNTVTVEQPIVSEAIKQPISKERVEEQISKFGNTPFVVDTFAMEMDDNLFINIKDLNEIRRIATEKFMEKRIYRELPKINKVKTEKIKVETSEKPKLFVSAKNQDQIDALISLNVDGIYVDNKEMVNDYPGFPLIYRSSRVTKPNEETDRESILVGETGTLFKNSKKTIITDSYLNVANHATAELLLQNAKRITLSPELIHDQIIDLLNYKNYPYELIVYGRLEVMILNHCILRMNVNKDKVCQVCKNDHHYFLMDRNGAKYPIVTDEFHRTHLYYFKRQDFREDIDEFLEKGLMNYRLELFDESKEEVIKFVTDLKNRLHI